MTIELPEDPDVVTLMGIARELNKSIATHQYSLALRRIAGRLQELVDAADFQKQFGDKNAAKQIKKAYAIERGYAPRIKAERQDPDPEINYVNKLQEMFQKVGRKIPQYTFSSTGADNDPQHICEVAIWLGDGMFPRVFSGSSKRKADAKQLASFRAYRAAHQYANKQMEHVE